MGDQHYHDLDVDHEHVQFDHLDVDHLDIAFDDQHIHDLDLQFYDQHLHLAAPAVPQRQWDIGDATR